MYISSEQFSRFIDEKYPKENKKGEKRGEAMLFIAEFLVWCQEQEEGKYTVC